MRSLSSLFLVALLAALGAAILPSSNVAYAAFHCMRIHAVASGWSGNGDIQYVELRMNAGGQTAIGGHTIKFYDSTFPAGTSLKATFTFPAGSVTNGTVGESILIGTEAFRDNTPGPGGPDYVFLGLMDPDGPQNTVVINGGVVTHPIQGPDGIVHFAQGSPNCDTFVGPVPSGEVDSVAYGTAPSHYVAAAAALPSPATTKALRLNVALAMVPPGLPADPMNNSTEYGLQDVATADDTVLAANVRTDLRTPRNNARQVLRIGPASVGGVSEASGGLGAPDGSAVADEDAGRGWAMPLTLALASVVVVATGGGLAAWRVRVRRMDDR